MRVLCFLILVVATAGLLVASSKKAAVSPAASMARKVVHIQANGKLAHPSPAPTVITEQEINAYLASDAAALPAGVQSVKLEGEPGVINGSATIDFDKVREGIHSSNPLLSVFSGVHDVRVATHAYGEGGMGYVHVDSVSLDGVEVPHFLLELFVEKYLTPRYPAIGLDSKFKLSDRIDSATVGEHQVAVVQK